jgi:hypothetical protein
MKAGQVSYRVHAMSPKPYHTEALLPGYKTLSFASTRGKVGQIFGALPVESKAQVDSFSFPFSMPNCLKIMNLDLSNTPFFAYNDWYCNASRLVTNRVRP